MLSKSKKTFEPVLAIIAFPFLLWNPSVLTLLGLFASVLFFIGIVAHLYLLSAISILGFLFDLIDGYVARKSGKVTALGAFLDSTLDRISDFFIISAFGFGKLISWELIVLVLFSSLYISYLRARAEGLFGQKIGGNGIMQRTERIILILLGFFLFLLSGNTGLLTYTFVIILLLNCITIVQRFFAFRKQSYA